MYTITSFKSFNIPAKHPIFVECATYFVTNV